MQTPLPSSGHLDIKDAQCAKKIVVVKLHISFISGLGAKGVQKGRFGRPKMQLSLKVAKFEG